MTSAWALSALLLGCASRGPTPAALGDPERAPLGVRIQRLDEGLLVVAAHPGTGAHTAGLAAGDLIVQVGDVDVARAPLTAQHGLRGPVGSTAQLVVKAPMTGDYREVAVPRGVRDPDAVAPIKTLPESVLALRVALLHKGKAAVRRTARAAVADDFGGMPPADAVSFYLRRALARRPAAAAAAATELSLSDPADDALRYKLGEVWHGVGDWPAAIRELSSSESSRPPDVWVPGQTFVGDAGGNPKGRRMLAEAHLALGQREPATELARELAGTWDEASLRASLGMAPLRQPQAWRAALPPIDDIDVATLDGQRWQLQAHRGNVVVVTFFATWCGPCRYELPELHALWAKHKDQGLDVLAVSTDGVDSVDALPAYVASMGLPFSVTHAPQLGQRFGVTGIPALRVIGRDGALVYSARGYSRGAMQRLERVVEGALAASGDGPQGQTQAQSMLGRAWSSGQAELVGFFGIPGTQAVVVNGDDVAVSRETGPPVVFAAEGGGAGLRTEGPAGGELLAWLDGPVVAGAGELWVRALSQGARARWLLTLSAPVRDLVAADELLWIATDDDVVAVDGLGRLQHQIAGGAVGLAAHPGGGVWATDGQLRRHLDGEGVEVERIDARGAHHVDASGRVASQVFEDVVTGRFGPDGALRSVVARTDGTVVGLDGTGRPVFTWELDVPPRLAVFDGDGDGSDDLLVAIRRQGLATVALSLP